ncbi:Hypothetical protein D9617_3g022350 [Elsinoe fawcettii]|nr:Hypothetical protein D9617_3g022350 [Elsinoe fawcettii]
METITLSRYGDVLIIPGSPPTKQYLVSSVILRDISPVFDNLFSIRFAGGQKPSATSPKQIPLPDDHDRAMEILLGVTHFRQDQNMQLREAPDFARLCDKYDCVKPLSQFMNA